MLLAEALVRLGMSRSRSGSLRAATKREVLNLVVSSPNVWRDSAAGMPPVAMSTETSILSLAFPVQSIAPIGRGIYRPYGRSRVRRT